jgi:hypothetical protein
MKECACLEIYAESHKQMHVIKVKETVKKQTIKKKVMLLPEGRVGFR